MKTFLSLLGAIAIGASATWFLEKRLSLPPPPPPLISLENMGNLVTVKVHYANVLESVEKIARDIPMTPWELRLGGTKVILVARGDCLVGTDIRLAKYQEVKYDLRFAALVLPEPNTISARVNHDSREKGGSYFYAVTGTGLEPIIPGSYNRTKAIDTALAAAQNDIANICSSPDVIATARKNTAAILVSTFSSIGWKVDIRWTK